MCSGGRLQLIALERRLRSLQGELGEQAQTMASRREQGRTISAAAEAKLRRLREAYATISRRCEELRLRGATLPAADDDF
jgi:hypothetical protein